jgi:hypothetical protein
MGVHTCQTQLIKLYTLAEQALCALTWAVLFVPYFNDKERRAREWRHTKYLLAGGIANLCITCALQFSFLWFLGPTDINTGDLTR